MILTRAVFQRLNVCLERKTKIEDLKECLGMVGLLPFKIKQTEALENKFQAGSKLLAKEKEILSLMKDPPDESAIPILQSYLNDSTSLRIVFPNFQKITQYIENCQSLSQIKEILESSKLFALSQVKSIYENMLKKFSKDLDCLQDLKQKISKCEAWFTEVKEELKTSQSKPLGSKLIIEELRLHLQKAKTLPFSMQNEIKILEEEIKSAED